MSKNNYTVEIYPMAEDDLDGIYKYYFEESGEESIAIKVVGELKESILGLENMPQSHPRVLERRLKKYGFRKLIFKDYIIPFLIDEDNKIVFVVRVFHGKMNYQKYL